MLCLLRFILWVVAVLVLVLVWFFMPSIVQSVIVPWNSIDPKTAPEGYTAFAALFSAFACLLLLKTLHMQRKELKKADHMHNLNIKMSAYTALLNYYDKAGYDPAVCKLTQMDIARKLNGIISESEENSEADS